MSIASNLRAVKVRIAEAAARSGRDPKDISLVAVSKGRSIDLIKEAAENGQLAFGENRAQELREKQGLLSADLEWHFVGHLQRNKVNMVVGKVKLIHSLDSEKLAEAVDRRARALGIVQEVLLQVNISEEETKHGVDREEIEGLLEKALAMDGLIIRGLMTIAPLVDDEEEARPYFRKLRELRDMLAENYPQADLNILSMGMTQDFEIAVEEGANMLRIGTAIFA